MKNREKMKTNNENFDKVLDKLVASTRSPRGRFSAANNWPLLKQRLSATRNRKRFLLRMAGTAAAVLLCVTGWLGYDAMRPVPMQTVSTLAQTRTIQLPDRSEVILNRYSTLTYPARFKGGRRTVELQGEAYFEVTKESGQPFIVQAGALNVQVLGTHFNVEAYADDEEVRTTLLEGVVAVSTDKRRVVLAPNESAVYNKKQGTLSHESTPDAANEILWSRGILFFNQSPLSEIVRHLSNAFHTEMRIDDPHLPDYRMTATFHHGESLHEILDLLKVAGGFSYTIQNKTIVITKPDQVQ